MIPVDAQTMLEIAPRFSGALAEAQRTIVNAVGPQLRVVLPDYDITTRLRVAHFLAQTCHESAGFRTTVEFASGQAYEGRADLGNTRKGDGPRYKGRGLIQLTGRANYRSVGAALGLDLEADPELAAEPVVSLRIACEFWKGRKINPACDADDIEAVTRKINGGINGLQDRAQLTAKAKTAIARLEGFAVAAAAPAGAPPVLRRGSSGAEVVELQRLLRDRGFALAVDGEFGPATELAVKQVQAAEGLEADGIVGPNTWARLAPPDAGQKVA